MKNPVGTQPITSPHLQQDAPGLIINSTQDAYLLIDENLAITYFNPAAANGVLRFLGQTLTVGLNIMELVPEGRKAALSQIYKGVFAGTPCLTENSFDLPTGETVYFENKFLPAYNHENKITGAIIHSKNITAQKSVEKALFKSNQRFDIMLKATHELLWDWDLKNNHVYRAKDGLKKVYGMADDNDIKSHDQWLMRLHPDDRQHANTLVAGFLQGSHEQTFELEYRFRKDDGSYAFIYDRGILLLDDEGYPNRLIGAAQDITKRKQLEQELLDKELAFQKLIHQATIDTQEEERSEIGKELHDNINQVLTTTKLYLDLAMTTADMREEMIAKSRQNIVSIINGIRQLSRSLMDPTIGDLGIADAINDLIENINLTRQLAIKPEVDKQIEGLLHAKQKLAIYRIIQESINNVLRHANAGQVKVVLKQEAAFIHLQIIDDGIGFVMETTKKGAGLKNMSNRAYLINGIFALQSQPGKGCTVSIKFPIQSIH